MNTCTKIIALVLADPFLSKGTQRKMVESFGGNGVHFRETEQTIRVTLQKQPCQMRGSYNVQKIDLLHQTVKILSCCENFTRLALSCFLIKCFVAVIKY